MKTAAVNKTTITIFSPTGKDCGPYSASASHLRSLSKLWSTLKTESEIIWILLNYSTPADHIQQLQASILSTTMRTSPTIPLVTTQDEAWPELQLKADTSITLIFHMMVTSGTSTHPWSMMTMLTPKTSRTNLDPLYMILTSIFELSSCLN